MTIFQLLTSCAALQVHLEEFFLLFKAQKNLFALESGLAMQCHSAFFDLCYVI